MKEKLIIVVTVILFNSCRTECHCNKDLGCLIVKVKKKYTDTIVADTTIYSSNDYYSDTNIKNIAGLYMSRYQNPPYDLVFETKYSIYQRLQVNGMSKWKETETFRKQGYICGCAK